MHAQTPAKPSFTDTSLPGFMPAVTGANLMSDGDADDPDPCTAVTRNAIEAAIDAIEGAKLKADENVTVNAGLTSDPYPTAAALAQDALVTALGTMNTLLGLLQGLGVFEPPDDRVSNAAAANNVYGYAREAIIQLHYARHWAAVSATTNRVRANAAAGVECTERASEALALVEPLSADATRCYVRAAYT